MTSSPGAPPSGAAEQPVDHALIPAPVGLPDGVTCRAADRADVPALVALLRAEEFALIGESAYTETEVAEWFDGVRERARGVTRVIEVAGRPVGLWRVFRNFDDKYPSQVVVDRSLERRLVDELWRAGVDWVERTALAVAATRGVTQPRADLWLHDGDALSQSHIEAAGFERARAFIEMQIELDGYTAVPPPAGLAIRRGTIDNADSTDLAAMYDVITESFRDHFDFQQRPLEDWAAFRMQDPLTARDHWYLAEVGGALVGGLIGHNAFVETDNAGYVANLGVLRSGRGRGVAKALLHTSFAHYRAEGRASVKLHVDAESPTGATHLYEAVGMYRRHIGYDYHKHLAAAQN